MRRVKFLLDYQGARESEYRLAREHHYATLVDPRERTSPVTSFPISETTLRQWDASTLEDLRKPLLPYYVPDSPGISLLPVSWVSSEKPLGGGGEDLVHRDSVGEQFHILASPENSIQSRSGQMDDDPLQLPPTQSPTPSSLKRKLVEYDIDSDVVKYALTRKRLHLESSTVDANIVIGKQFPTARNRPPISGPGGQGHHGASASHISWHIHERATLSRPACDASGALQLVAASLDNTLALRALDFIETAPTDQLPFSPLPSHDIEPFSPSSLTSAVSATLSYVSPPGYASQKLYPPRSRNVELEGHYEFTPLLDYALDSSSDSSLAITGASYGNLADTAPFPAKGARAIVTLQGELFPFPVVAYTKIFGPSSEIEVGLPGSSRLEDSRQSYKTNELVPIRYKRKRLFIAYEDNYEGRVHKSRSIE
ncbi:hypothetical protein B0F90DRAFT_99107 [Multifurca ochricompacta]|uniref:Uncharacterized protein n=1 Tax=Multifurca ochricompacta TaxID=376703 RepID=A0AAD4QTT6_9AGAM|nr:hypothetical protein B0F90DRAFT_99107 [Multifurca ochricompacta]